MKLTSLSINVKRIVLAACVLLPCCSQWLEAANHAGSAGSPAGWEHIRSLTLWYRQPAAQWTEALPIGNGRLGAMVFGGVEREHLQLNEDTLWSGGPHCYDNPNAYKYLAVVRELLARG